MICSEGSRRLQELDGKRRKTKIYTGSVRRKIMAPYVQCGVDSMLHPALCHPLDLYRDLEVSVVCCMVCSCVGVDLGTPASFI